jgi:iron complex outermembrane receptor protein
MNGNTWAISSRGSNRQYSNKLLIMIDGRTIYTPIFSGALWDAQDYVLEDVDRIEVIRGPGGSIWGANAMNGIINIITKSAAETKGTYISQTFGDNDRSITEVRHGGKINGKDDYRIYAKHAVRNGNINLTDGKDADDGILNDRLGFQYNLSSSKDQSLSIHGDVFNEKAQNYFPNVLSDARNDKVSKGANVVVKWDRTISEKSSIMLQTYFDFSRIDIPVLKVDERTFDIDFQHYYNASEQNQLIWGLGYRNLQDSIESNLADGASGSTYYPLTYTPNRRNIDLYSAFIQDKISIIADELYLTLGSKFEHNDLTGFEYQPNARLTYYPSRNQTLWTSISRAIRTPTRGEDNIEIRFPVRGLGNPVLNKGSNTYESEVVIAYEAGYRIKPTYDTSIDIATFYNDYSSLRTFESSTTFGAPTAYNRGSGESYGFELNAKWQVTSDWKLEASYDFLKVTLHLDPSSTENSTALNTGRLEYEEEQSPQNQFKLRSLYNISSDVEFDNILYYVDSVPKARSSQTNGEEGVPSYVRWDSRIGYLVNKNLDFSVGIQNILDDRHQEYSASLFSNKTEVPRTYYVKAVVQF